MKLLDLVRHVACVQHFSSRTEPCCVHWIECIIRFHGIRHGAEMGAGEVEAILTHLAVEGHVAASTQSQGLAALSFLYREVLGKDIGLLNAVQRGAREMARAGAAGVVAGGSGRAPEDARSLADGAVDGGGGRAFGGDRVESPFESTHLAPRDADSSRGAR